MKHLKRYNSYIFESVTKDIRDRFVELCEEKLDSIEFELSMCDSECELGDIADVLREEYPNFAKIEVTSQRTSRPSKVGYMVSSTDIHYFEVYLKAFETSEDIEDRQPTHYKKFDVDDITQDDPTKFNPNREPPY